MPRPHLGELAYAAYWQYLEQPGPIWDTLALGERLAWGMAARAAIQEAHRVRCPSGVHVDQAEKPPSRLSKGR